PKADIPTVAMNVRFRGKSGHFNFSAACPLLTRSDGKGQSQTFDDVCITFVKLPIADSCPTSREVQDGPKCDICSATKKAPFVTPSSSARTAPCLCSWRLAGKRVRFWL